MPAETLSRVLAEQLHPAAQVIPALVNLNMPPTGLRRNHSRALTACSSLFRSNPTSRHSRGPSACLKSATSSHVQRGVDVRREGPWCSSLVSCSWVSLIHRGYELAEFGWTLFPGGGRSPWIRGTRVSRNRRPPQHLADLLYLADALHGAVEEWVVRGSLIPMGD